MVTVAITAQITYVSVSMCPCVYVRAHIGQKALIPIYRWGKFRKQGGHHGHVDTANGGTEDRDEV